LRLRAFVHLSGLAGATNGNLARALVSAAPAFRIYRFASSARTIFTYVGSPRVELCTFRRRR